MNKHFYRYGKPKTTWLSPVVELTFDLQKRNEEIKLQPLPPIIKCSMMMSLCAEMTARAASIPSRKRHPFEHIVQFTLKNGELDKDVKL